MLIPDILYTIDTSRYVSIIKSEGLEISQPALDPNKSEVHHQITAHGRRTKVHRYSSRLIVISLNLFCFNFFLLHPMVSVLIANFVCPMMSLI
jgi:hypothetical protein